jgi:hypothetical protein
MLGNSYFFKSMYRTHIDQDLSEYVFFVEKYAKQAI